MIDTKGKLKNLKGSHKQSGTCEFKNYNDLLISTKRLNEFERHFLTTFDYEIFDSENGSMTLK
jgi:hypothetical protein